MDIQQKRLIGAKILGAITLILMLISQPRYEISIDIIGFTLIVLSGVGRIWSSAYIAGLKSKRVISYGPYSIMRNPLYFFSSLGSYRSWSNFRFNSYYTTSSIHLCHKLTYR